MHAWPSGYPARYLWCAAAVLALSMAPLCAVEIHPRAGTTAAAFLKYDAGSRGAAMGGAFSAVADDATALYWNPAGLSSLRARELTVAHTESFERIRHDFAVYAFPFHSGTLAVAGYGLYTPKDLERRAGLHENDPYEPLSPVEGYFQAYDAAAHIAYGRSLSPRLSAGCGIKLIRQVIDDATGTGIAADAGVRYRLPWHAISTALVLQHAGTPIAIAAEQYDLPLTIRAGAAGQVTRRLLASIDLQQPNDNFLSIATGAEYRASPLLALRAGYKYRTRGNELDGLYGFTAGIGFTFQLTNLAIKLDYAFAPYGVLGTAHRVSLTARFDGKTGFRPAEAAVPAPAGRKQPGEHTRAPALPLDPAPAQGPAVLASTAAYAMMDATVERKLRAAGGTTPVYSITARANASPVAGLRSITGVVKGAVPAVIAIQFGERPAAENGYRDYCITKNFPAPLQKVFGVISVPKHISRPHLRTRTGVEIPLTHFSEDGPQADLYTFKADTFEPFTILGSP